MNPGKSVLLIQLLHLLQNAFICFWSTLPIGVLQIPVFAYVPVRTVSFLNLGPVFEGRHTVCAANASGCRIPRELDPSLLSAIALSLLLLGSSPDDFLPRLAEKIGIHIIRHFEPPSNQLYCMRFGSKALL